MSIQLGLLNETNKKTFYIIVVFIVITYVYAWCVQMVLDYCNKRWKIYNNSIYMTTLISIALLIYLVVIIWLV